MQVHKAQLRDQPAAGSEMATLAWDQRYNDTQQGWPTSISSRAKNKKFQVFRAAHKFMALKVRGNLYMFNNK
jgi:hypothetical protein